MFERLEGERKPAVRRFPSRRCILNGLLLLMAASVSGGRANSIARSGEAPEARALAYLAREVPRWSRDNRCFSCHNNGDATRAILAAKADRSLPPEILAETLAFLSQPDRWEKNGVDAAFSDKRLARIQFASALSAAVKAGRIEGEGALRLAADLVAKDQDGDGSWSIDESVPVGSPATYGPPLATAMAIGVLQKDGLSRHGEVIDQAKKWMRARPLLNMNDAASLMMALMDEPPSDRALRDGAMDLLRRGQNPDGGWGPFARSASEPFDTALALIALKTSPNSPELEGRISRGRAYLIANQAADGSWRETTRPAGGESYAQRLSTAGWATIALLATRPPGPIKATAPAGP
ncbi:MAG: hypothetical protein JWN86_1609 [Planctomycetota bacterium]|nr:hypothetical protein [Planctomycetota bacterium]